MAGVFTGRAPQRTALAQVGALKLTWPRLQ
jgi:hypothetical protein